MIHLESAGKHSNKGFAACERSNSQPRRVRSHSTHLSASHKEQIEDIPNARDSLSPREIGRNIRRSRTTRRRGRALSLSLFLSLFLSLSSLTEMHPFSGEWEARVLHACVLALTIATGGDPGRSFRAATRKGRKREGERRVTVARTGSCGPRVGPSVPQDARARKRKGGRERERERERASERGKKGFVKK